MNDYTGRVPPEEQGPPKGTRRTLTVALDPTQYQLDATTSATSAQEIYSSFTLLMRRNSKDYNFKSIL